MTSEPTVHLTQSAYQALLARNENSRTASPPSKPTTAAASPTPSPSPSSAANLRSSPSAPTAVSPCASLPARTGISPSYLSEIERRRKPGSAATLAKLAATLNTTIDTLLTDRDPV